MRIELDFEADIGDSRSAITELVRELAGLERQTEQTVRDLKDLGTSKAKTAETVASLKSIEAALDDVKDEAQAADRALEGLDRRTLLFRTATPGGSRSESALTAALLAGLVSGRGGGGGGGFGGGAPSFGGGGGGSVGQGPLGGFLPGGARAGVGPTLGLGALGLGAASGLAPGGAALLAAIPGLAGAATAAVAGLAIGFVGLGDAIGGDKEAFDALTPSAQKFVQEVRTFIPFLKELREELRDGLLPGAAEGLHAALSPEMVDHLRQSFAGLGLTLGDVAREWGLFLGDDETVAKLREITEHTFGWIEGMSDTAINLTDALLTITAAAGPFTDWVVAGIEAGSEWIATWLEAKEATGELGAFFEDAKEPIRTVGDLIGSAGGLLLELGQALDGPGLAALELLGDAFDELAETISDNQEEIEAFAYDGVQALGDVVSAVWPVLKDLVSVLDDIVEAVGDWESVFEIILTGLLLSSVGKLAGGFTGLAGGKGKGGIGAADVAAIGLLGNMKSLKALSPIGIEIIIAQKFMDGDPLGWQNFIKGLTEGDWSKILTGDKGIIGGLFADKAVDPGTGAGTAGLGGGLSTPTSIKPTHETANLPGFPAVDIFAKPGTKLLAPENGTLTRTTGNSPSVTPADFKGYSLYFVGNETGNTYFITHLATVAKPGYYRRGDVIATIAAGTSGGAHAHVGIHKGPAAAAYMPSTSSPPSPFGGSGGSSGSGKGGSADSPASGKPPAWDPPSGGGVDSYELPIGIRTQIARAGVTGATKDDLAAYIAARKRIQNDLPKLSGEVRVDALEQLKRVQAEIARITKGPDPESNYSLPIRIKTQIAKAETTKGAGDDLKAYIAARNAIKKALPNLSGDVKVDALQQLKTVLDQIGRLQQEGKASASEVRAGKLGLAEILQDLDKFPQLREIVAGEIAKIRKLLSGVVTDKELDQAERMINALGDKVAAGIDRITEEIRQRAEEWRAAWGELTRAALEAFDAETRAMLKAYDAETRAYLTPTEQLLKEMDAAALAKSDADALAAAEKNLADAKAGTSGGGSGGGGGGSGHDARIDKIKETIARYALANDIDTVQSLILGGEHANIGDALIEQLKKDLASGVGGGGGAGGGGGGGGNVVDPEAVKRAEEELQAIKDRIHRRGLEEKAAAERKEYEEGREAGRTALEKERDDLRDHLVDSLDEWGKYYEEIGMGAEDAAALFVATWAKALAQVPNPVPGSNDEGQGTGYNPPDGGAGYTSPGKPILMPVIDATFAEGGVVLPGSGPMVGLLNEKASNKGEAVIPLDKLHDFVGGTNVQVNFAEGMEWLEQFLDVRILRQAPAISRQLGQAANRRRRSGRYR